MPKIKRIESGEEIEVAVQPTLVAGVWECGDQRFTDPDGDQYEAMPAEIIYPKVGPIHFQMLFEPAEMITADELKATDKVLASFWKLVDDPRTDTIDLGLQSVQNAIEYTLTAVKAAGVAVDVPARKAAILSGVLS